MSLRAAQSPLRKRMAEDGDYQSQAILLLWEADTHRTNPRLRRHPRIPAKRKPVGPLDAGTERQRMVEVAEAS